MIVGDELPPGISDPSQLNQTLNIDPDDVRNGSVSPFPFNNESIAGDLSHAWSVAHADYDNGKMDGFVTAEKSINTMGYYDRNDIPYYWDYADHYVLDDNFFSSEMGPSFPNHLYIASGANGPTTLTHPGWILNGGVIDNPRRLTVGMRCILIGQRLLRNCPAPIFLGNGMTETPNPWLPLFGTFSHLFTYFQDHPEQLGEHVANTEQFISDTQNGQLPAVSWIIPGAWVPPTYPAICQWRDAE